MRLIYGIGERKLNDFGKELLEVIRKHCSNKGISMDMAITPNLIEKKLPALTEVRSMAFELFRKNKSVDIVVSETGRARGTVLEYFSDYLERESPEDISAYVSNENYEKIRKTVEEVGMERLKPIYLVLNETISYDEIRIVVAHLKGRLKQTPMLSNAGLT